MFGPSCALKKALEQSFVDTGAAGTGIYLGNKYVAFVTPQIPNF